MQLGLLKDQWYVVLLVILSFVLEHLASARLSLVLECLELPNLGCCGAELVRVRELGVTVTLVLALVKIIELEE